MVWRRRSSPPASWRAVAQLDELATRQVALATGVLSGLHAQMHETSNAIVGSVAGQLHAVQARVAQQTQAAVGSVTARVHAVQTRVAETQHTAMTSAHSLVAAVVSAPAVTSALSALVFAEGKFAGAVGVASDFSEVAIGTLLAPESEEEQESCLAPEVDAAAPDTVLPAVAVGDATSAAVVRVKALAAKLRTRVVRKTVRHVRAAQTQLHDRIQPVLATAARLTAPASPPASQDAKELTVTFAGFSITPVSNFAETTLTHVRALDQRRTELLQALHSRLEQASVRVAQSIPAVPRPDTLQLARAVHVRAAAVVDAHPWLETALASLHLPTLLPAPIARYVQAYVEWVRTPAAEASTDDVLADDEQEEEDDGADSADSTDVPTTEL